MEIRDSDFFFFVSDQFFYRQSANIVYFTSILFNVSNFTCILQTLGKNANIQNRIQIFLAFGKSLNVNFELDFLIKFKKAKNRLNSTKINET